MIKLLSHPKLAQLANVVLRLVSLGAKLALTVYMGRYLELSEIGIYGLVFGAVIILTRVAGMNLEFFASRDIVGIAPDDALFKMRDEAFFYTLTCLPLAIVALALSTFGLVDWTAKILFHTLFLTFLESIGTMNHTNMIAYRMPIKANLVFLTRSGIWALPVIVMGMLFPALRNAETILIAWEIGAVLSFIAAFFCWNNLPWRQVIDKKVNWTWLRTGIRKSVLVWIGAVGITAGAYVDRAVVAHFINMDAVGIVTFYFSFANSLLALMQSGIYSITYPKLVLLNQQKNAEEFTRVSRSMTREGALWGGLLTVACGAGISLAVPLLGRPALLEGLVVFWLMLASAWLRINADGLNYVLYARHQDRPIWLGNLLFLVPSVCLNLLFVPLFGLNGIGYGAIASAIFLFAWRKYWAQVHPAVQP